MSKYPKRVNGKLTRLYAVWSNFRQRCNNSNNPQFHNYGGRGIQVCNAWNNSYDAFYEWAMSNGYDETGDRKLQTLDRADNNKGYSPDNCRWVSMKVQGRNRRDNVKIGGKCLSEIGGQYGISASVVKYRQVRALPLDTPVHHITLESLSLADFCIKYGLDEKLVRNRIRAGITDIKSLKDPVNKDNRNKTVYVGGRTLREIAIEAGIPPLVVKNRWFTQNKHTLQELQAPYIPKRKKRDE